jgi:isopenicillin N synthase-like dioxygenase
MRSDLRQNGAKAILRTAPGRAWIGVALRSPVSSFGFQGWFNGVSHSANRPPKVFRLRDIRPTGRGRRDSQSARGSRLPDDASLAFFDRPAEDKDRFKPSQPGSRGYSAMRGRTVGIAHDKTLLKSLQESYGIGPSDVPTDDYFHSAGAGHSFATNVWPEEPADFEPAMRAYYSEMERVFSTIMRMFAITLDLPETYFDDKINRHSSVLRLTHYPALDSEPLPGEQRAGAHTDIGALTILHIDDTPNSLQVQLRSGEWINVNRVPGAFIINIGDMMMRWTNDKWLSNMHRVVNPPFVNGHSKRRLSIVFFCQTNHDTVVECLPNCAEPGTPPRYPPIVSGEYSAMRAAMRYGYDLPANKR